MNNTFFSYLYHILHNFNAGNQQSNLRTVCKLVIFIPHYDISLQSWQNIIIQNTSGTNRWIRSCWLYSVTCLD